MEDEPDMYAAKYLKAAMVRLPSNAAMTARVPASLWAMASHSRPTSPSGQPCARDPPIPCPSPDPPRPPSMGEGGNGGGGDRQCLDPRSRRHDFPHEPLVKCERPADDVFADDP